MGFIAVMMSGWMIDDSLASRLTGQGWAWIAVQRVALWLVVGLTCWAAIVGVNRLVMPRLGLHANGPRSGSVWSWRQSSLLLRSQALSRSLPRGPSYEYVFAA